MKKTTRPAGFRLRAGLWGVWLLLASGPVARAQHADAPHARAAKRGEDVFLRAVASSPTAYAGQALTVSYLLYYRVPVVDPDAEINLKFKNCQAEEYPATAREHRETVAGKPYQVRVLKQYHVVPELAGTLQLPALARQYSFRAPPAPEDFFGEPKMVSKRVTSEEVQVPVRPLPAAPDSVAFANIVGRFRFRPSYTVSRKSANLLTFQLKITGDGNLRKTKLTPPALPAGLDAFNIAGQEKHTLTAKGLKAEYTYSYDVLANYRGTYSLPGIRVLGFDPEQGNYTAYRAPAYTWRVEQGPVAPAALVAGPGRAARKNAGLQTKASLFQNDGQLRFLGSHAYYGGLLLAVGLLLAGAVQTERLRRRAANPRRYLARTARARAVAALRRHARAETPLDAHCKALSETLVDYLSARFGLAPVQLTVRELPVRLQARAVPEELQRETVAFLQALAKIRFSGHSSGAADGPEAQHLLDLITRLDACPHDEIPASLVPAAR
ncbi:BatD family protein [Hymenobacter sp. BT523]|uniref:BatD family protein n=1 Tax=Hymenobacter sp. BT523 TaxID=2795725 RepID=UPI0018EC2D48|nr:BatD family protein [Hymenobacter sp. BT523]MBJ6110392.1 BatD family protein [Hymenobacter sp. BT523]